MTVPLLSLAYCSVGHGLQGLAFSMILMINIYSHTSMHICMHRLAMYTIYNIIQLVSLFVCLFANCFWRKNYGTERLQTLKNYNVGLQKCSPPV